MLENKTFSYSFKNYSGENHNSLPVRSASDAVLQFFDSYAPIYTLNDSVLLQEDNLINYLSHRYEIIEETYGIKLPIREEDLSVVAWLIEEQENWAQLQQVGLMQIDLFPRSVYGYYTLGLAAEKNGNLKEALAYYRTGYSKLGDDVSNKSDFYSDIERVEVLLQKEK